MENKVTTSANAWNMAWSFTQPGQYCLSVRTVVKSYKPSATRSAQATYTVVVGDRTDPATVTPCAQVPLAGGSDDGHDSGAVPTGKPTVLGAGHLDMRAVLDRASDGITFGVKPAAFSDTKDVVLTGAYGPATVGESNEALDPRLIGPAGTKYWYFQQGGAEGAHLWPGLSTEGWKVSDIAPGANIDFTLNGVVVPTADARVVIFDNTASDDGFVTSRPSGVWFDSSRLPMTRTSQIGAHQHMNWAFTAAGRYCLNITAKTRLASGSWASDSGMVTVWIGDPAAASDVVPCDRDTAPPQATLQPLTVTPTTTATVARAGGADLTTYLTGAASTLSPGCRRPRRRRPNTSTRRMSSTPPPCPIWAATARART
ncbi:hypothetical protein O159_04100 [Leifsonia xyli subsp. cynodontis DSM 46306]|uniref:Uncharacterized protein n=1 Tax=Leifsonia xyli subsp. cynodontis DSM 46306 TaxID=1389489 RepID=U3P580_LEIXC|nr:choice-of-anchor M domain-containing protein [Leifsonia xyli]AGW40619.1 hypothetical protein O159_04100 [Leifsonia xyli subsp. cynodontis DSM 46306]